jgi:hypothetical protein
MRPRPLTEDQLRARMILRGVEATKEFGFPLCDAENILTDYIYGRIFETQLKDVVGDPELKKHPTIQKVAEDLIAEIRKHNP